MKNSALGLIETYGLIGAIEALDTAVKAAEVKLVDLTKVKGGIMTLTIEGDVSAVKASVDAGSAAAERLGTLRSFHVIPRLDEEVWPMIERKSKVNAEEEPPKKTPGILQEKSPEEPPPEGIKEEAPEKSLAGRIWSKKELAAMKVMDLRKLARRMEEVHIPSGQVKYANKEVLIKEILLAQGRRDKQ